MMKKLLFVMMLFSSITVIGQEHNFVMGRMNVSHDGGKILVDLDFVRAGSEARDVEIIEADFITYKDDEPLWLNKDYFGNNAKNGPRGAYSFSLDEDEASSVNRFDVRIRIKINNAETRTGYYRELWGTTIYLDSDRKSYHFEASLMVRSEK